MRVRVRVRRRRRRNRHRRMMPVLRMERVGPMRIRVVRGMEGLLGGAAGAGSRCAGPSSSRGVRRRGRAPRRGEGGGPTAGQPLPRIGGAGCFYVGVILLGLGISTSTPCPGAHGKLLWGNATAAHFALSFSKPAVRPLNYYWRPSPPPKVTKYLQPAQQISAKLSRSK